jgi:hypothetical protein
MRYGLPVVERAMKMQEIVLRAMSGTISWLQAADLCGTEPPDGAPLARAV